MRAEVYLATGLAVAAATGALVLALESVYLALRVATAAPVTLLAWVALALAPALLAAAAHYAWKGYPSVLAYMRGRDIDAKLPYALNYISTMSGAGFTPERIFSALAAQPVYGEVAREAAWITRDLRVLGNDLVSALNAGIRRTPSQKFADLLQGAVTTFTSGGQLRDYFVSKSEQFLDDNRQNQKKFLEGLAIISESYVTVVVAAPLFLMIFLSIMLMFGGGGTKTLSSGYLMVLIVVPLAQLGFAMTIKTITPEV